MRPTTDHKQAAIEQWTADPCAAVDSGAEPGTREYFEQVLAVRRDYGPWIPEALGYAGTEGLRLLDVGCGQGIDLYEYARAGARATGVDLTPRHVELARAHLSAMGVDAEVVEGDAEALPFADGSFDRVSSHGVIHHTPDIEAALREIHRVLRPGGEARILVYNRNSLHYWLHQVLVAGIVRGGLVRERSMEGVLSRNVEYSRVGARPLVRVLSPRRLRRLMREARFAGVETSIRHFRPEDTFVTGVLARRVRRLRDPQLLDRIGRAAGWYVVGRGFRGAA